MNFDVGKGPEAIESELPALEQLVAMGYQYITQAELNKTRTDYRDVLLYDRLEQAIRRLNPEFDDDGINDAVAQISEDRFPHNLDPVETNEIIRAKLIGLSKSGGLEPVVVTQNFGEGPVQKVAKIFDFDNIENNDFVVTNQFQLDGFKNSIFPDITIFVNGIPLVQIECKSPAIPDPIGEAVDRKNFYKYQQRGNGYEKLFFYNHCLIAACGTLARVGTLNSNVNYYSRWAKPYPLTIDQVKELNGKSREQEILIAGLLTKGNLLNHMQNFVLYDTINNNRIKMIAKHQQYRAVSECVNRLQLEDDIKDKGGIIWHTQGSGKSFSMLWFASQLMYKFGNPPIIIVTDRKQLDKQIHDTFKKCGFPSPIRTKNGKHLAELLQNPKGKTIMTIIDKFATEHNAHTDEKVIVLVDEAHRSQYKVNSEQMRESMPNAVFYGFTGTPIDKKDHNTRRVFGPVIDKYGFRESQEDGATLPIRYQGRLSELFVEGGETIDELFDRIIGSDPSITEELKDKLKKQCVTKGKIAEAPSRIKRIALDLVKHYTTHIEPNGYKAMLVAPSREAAILYKKTLDELNAPPSKVIMTSNLGEKGKDEQSWDKYFLSDTQREQEAEKFKSADDPTKIIIVVDMLLVGYDAPICQVLYLDKGIREHNLLQAIARVNRPYDEPKTHGLIVDYSGVTKELQTALEMFEKDDIEGALDPIDEFVQLLKDRHADAIVFFKDIDREDNDAIIEYFEPIDRRDEFEQAFKLFSKALDSVMPDKEAGPYIDDFKFLSKARQIIRTYYEGVKPSTRPYAKKIQKLIDDHIRSLRISELIDPMEITYENFLSFVKKKVKSERAQTALIKNKAIQVIEELKGNNPAYYERLLERLQKIIEEEEKRRRENAQYFTHPEVYEEVYNKALAEEKERQKVFGDYEATQFEFALYGEFNEIKDNREESISLTKKIYSQMVKETEIVGWRTKISVEKNMKTILYEELSAAGFTDEKLEELSEKILTLAKNKL
jgi:type I restriction enzyme, R subunit